MGGPFYTRTETASVHGLVPARNLVNALVNGGCCLHSGSDESAAVAGASCGQQISFTVTAAAMATDAVIVGAVVAAVSTFQQSIAACCDIGTLCDATISGGRRAVKLALF